MMIALSSRMEGGKAAKVEDSGSTWPLIDLLFNRKNDLYRHQYENFDFFVQKIIPQEIRNTNVIDEHEDAESRFFYSMRFRFDHFQLKPPSLENGTDYMTPMIARHRNLSYFGTLVADVEQVQECHDLLTDERTVKTIEQEKSVPLARIPIMVKSRYCTTSIAPELATEECRFDPGCYFIVNGSEKVVLSMERLARNKIYVHEKKKDHESEFRAVVTSQREDTDSIAYGYTVSLKVRHNGGIYFTGCGLQDIPMAIVLRALGLGNDEEMTHYILQMPRENDLEMANCFYHSIRECVDEEGRPLRTVEDALAYLATKAYLHYRFYSADAETRAKQRRIHLEKSMKDDLLPHVEGGPKQKGIYLSVMVNKLLQGMLGRIKVDDRDTFTNRRIDMPGILLGQLFRQSWNRMMKECGNHFRKRNSDDRQPPKMISQIKPLTIEQSFRSALLTGRWGMSRTKHGVARVLERLSYILSVAQFRQIITPTLDEKNSKVSSMRNVHPSQLGYLCIVETPEGEKIGLVKNLAMSATITTTDMISSSIIKDIIRDRSDTVAPEDLDSRLFHTKFFIIVDGDLVALSDAPSDIVDTLIRLKLQNKINRYTSVCFDAEAREVRVYTDTGRMTRPLLRVSDYKLLLSPQHLADIDLRAVDPKKCHTWDQFIARHPDVVEYVDIEQSPYSLIAMYPRDIKEARTLREMPPAPGEVDRVNRFASMYSRYSHCELHPSLLLGMSASCIPFSNMNQTPRNTYQFAQAKQAMGIYATNWMNRFDISNVLYHPQVPIVTTRATQYTGLMDLPNGENVIVAIAPFTGYNQEDSLVLNAASVARGVFRSTYVKKYNSTIEKNQVSSQDDIHTKPDRNLVMNIRADVNYEKLNSQGFIEEETRVENGDAILGKVSPIQPSEKSAKVFKDKSEVYKGFYMMPATVDKVQTGLLNGEGYEMYNMRIRSERIPMVGDKFSSRSGQKATAGIIVPEEDMPFTESGIRPDLIITPNCIPSRMTIGQLVEMMLAKVGALKGRMMDGTTFEERDIESMCSELESLGYDRYGYETVYSGVTGEKLEMNLFIGPCYYQRLKHQVIDKIHARATGPMVMLTRQPPDGRTKNGGYRFGEMERDVAISHGISAFLKERMNECSDKTEFHVCDRCGMLASRLKNMRSYACHACQNHTDISKVAMPYAFKLLIQELLSINIAPRIRTKRYEDDDI